MAETVNKRHRAQRPRPGTRISVPADHWFFMNSKTPAVRIAPRRGPGSGWVSLDPGRRSGLIVFVADSVAALYQQAARIELVAVNRSVAFGRDAT